MKYIHFYLGCIIGKRYRLFYWKRYNHSWMWGVTKFIKETPVTETSDSAITRDMYEDYLNSLK